MCLVWFSNFLRLITLDTHAPRAELESSLQGQSEEQSDEIFEIDNCEMEAEVPNYAELHPIAHSLDLSLTLIFRYIREYCYPDGETLNMNRTKSLYLDMIKVCVINLIFFFIKCIKNLHLVAFFISNLRPLFI